MHSLMLPNVIDLSKPAVFRLNVRNYDPDMSMWNFCRSAASKKLVEKKYSLYKPGKISTVNRFY